MSCLDKQPDSEHLALESPFACAGSCMADHPSRVVVDSKAMRAVSCSFAVKGLSGWSFVGMRRYNRRVFADMSRIWTMTDA